MSFLSLGNKFGRTLVCLPRRSFYRAPAVEAFHFVRVSSFDDFARGLFSFWGIDLLIIARANTDIRSVADLKGHRVGFGPPGSGSANMSQKILAEYGLTYKDVKPQFISATEQSQALKDKSLDAAMYTIGTPAATFVDLCTLNKMRIIPIEKDMMAKILKSHPYYGHGIDEYILNQDIFHEK